MYDLKVDNNKPSYFIFFPEKKKIQDNMMLHVWCMVTWNVVYGMPLS